MDKLPRKNKKGNKVHVKKGKKGKALSGNNVKFFFIEENEILFNYGLKVIYIYIILLLLFFCFF